MSDLLREIEDVQQRLTILAKQRAFSLLNIYSVTGVLFLIVFLITITQHNLIAQSIATCSFFISCIGLLRTTADIIHHKRANGYSLLFSIITVLILSLSYYYLWTVFLHKYVTVMLIAIGLYAIVLIMFYLLHAYKSYEQNKARKEAGLTAVSLLILLMLVLATALYSSTILVLLLTIAVLIITKTTFDFTSRFVRK